MLKLRHCVAFKLDRRIGDLMFVNRPEAAYERGVAGEHERGHDDHRDFESRIAQIEQLQSLERGRHNYVALPCKQHKQIGGAYPRGIAYVEDCFAKVFAFSRSLLFKLSFKFGKSEVFPFVILFTIFQSDF